MQWPVEEIEKLRTNRVGQPSTTLLKAGSVVEVSGVTAAQVLTNYCFFNSLDKNIILLHCSTD